MTFKEFMAKVEAKNPGEPEFLQAVKEVVETIWDVYESNPRFVKNNVLERLVEPERTIIFRVPWMDDNGEVHVNRGIRVQYNSAIGPYKGGIRFHPSVNLSILKFLGFEQIFKNSLTSLPMGGGKGGSDFDARGRSDAEIMRFCQSFMAELYRHIGADLDVPAGDIGVGAREVGYMYGYYKKLRNEFTGVFTGKGRSWGGSLIRPEATGFGVIYFTHEMLKTKGTDFKGKTVALSGFGQVAWGAAQKVTELGGKVVTLSGPDGYIYDEDGLDEEKIAYMTVLRSSNNDRIADYVDQFPKAKFFPGKRPWEVKVDIAVPAATQNELDAEDAKKLLANGVMCVCEAANMPCTAEAMEILLDSKILYAPGKAANAGGVATSGLEMTQNSIRLSWDRDEVDEKLQTIMRNIHSACIEHGTQPDGYVNYFKGANIAGFIKVATAMCDQGLV
ncbi:MAG: NADP-specific glutamate dehydrogenase [Candidatus Cloacimonetes bacterium]|jgi:glutamate dehydrogenase (NADP+)|nr:NADP-specific glutamate dehydrogenase [Candidatus Cloacimonadota bacterium]NLO43861.1 NADP-specific glutamate dehydrogenase [Candidatus Cloacimonadota bacterium]